ncbi:MAG: hypothetical protein ACREN7_00335 [Candidatus Dormibacteria bacterium]
MPTELWHHYEVKLRVDRLTGGIPANPKLLDAWLAANGAPPEAKVEQARTQAQLQDQEVEEHTSAFARDADGHPCYESRCFKAALKEAANVIKERLEIKNARARLAEQVFVGPRLVPIAAPVKVDERVIHVMTRMGPRDSLKRFEYAEDVQLGFDLKALIGGPFKEGVLRTLIEYLQDGGIGADRSQGSGTIAEWELAAV